ncbi:MAG: hypothetical protein GY820_35555 [Gammaproteobacteria bacterium]|nr:hypothetical protein [Gammaproteobacteria bacterium]
MQSCIGRRLGQWFSHAVAQLGYRVRYNVQFGVNAIQRRFDVVERVPGLHNCATLAVAAVRTSERNRRCARIGLWLKRAENKPAHSRFKFFVSRRFLLFENARPAKKAITALGTARNFEVRLNNGVTVGATSHFK